MRKSSANATASATFAIGPAAETIAMPVLPVRRRDGFTGTGLPQPNPTMSSITVPAGSRCRFGLSVTRPSRAAVSSPSRNAVTACDASWNVMAMSSEDCDGDEPHERPERIVE